MKTRTLEITVGAFIAVGFAALFMLAMQVSNLSSFNNEDGYEIIARFDNIGGLNERAYVSMAGVRIGRVTGVEFDRETFQAKVRMNIRQQYDQIPTDTSASILTSGILGDQYIGLDPGGAEQYLKEGSEVRLTQSAMILEQIIGQFLFDKAAEGPDNQK